MSCFILTSMNMNYSDEQVRQNVMSFCAFPLMQYVDIQTIYSPSLHERLVSNKLLMFWHSLGTSSTSAAFWALLDPLPPIHVEWHGYRMAGTDSDFGTFLTSSPPCTQFDVIVATQFYISTVHAWGTPLTPMAARILNQWTDKLFLPPTLQSYQIFQWTNWERSCVFNSNWALTWHWRELGMR